MKAVLLMRGCVFPVKAAEASAEVKAGLRALAQSEMFTILLEAKPEGSSASGAAASRSAAAVEAAGGRIDAVVWCPHTPGSDCSCWQRHPGLILEALSRFDLQASDCYLIAGGPGDADLAMAAGVRPVLILQGQTVGSLLGDRRTHKDFPIAQVLAQAVDYVLAEERSTAQLGKPRQIVPSLPSEETSRSVVGKPAVTPISRLAMASSRRNRLRPREAARWLSFFIVGGVWLSLGIAYLLTHLYREQPFPEVFWYLTLQFIPRVVRGILFILTGVAVVFLASRNFVHNFANGQALRRR